MANGLCPNTGWVQITTTAAPLSTTSVPVPGGIVIYSASALSIGNRQNITHAGNATTDGFQVPAGLPFAVPPEFWPRDTPPDLNSLYAIAAGTINAWLIYPRSS